MKYTRYSIVLWVLLLAACGIWQTDVIEAVRNTRQPAQKQSFRPIAQYPWEGGIIVAYSVAHPPLDMTFEPWAIGFAETVNRNGWQVLGASEIDLKKPAFQQPLQYGVSRLDTPSDQYTTVSGLINIADVYSMTVAFEGGVIQTVQPISNTFAVGMRGNPGVCLITAYNHQGAVVLEKVPETNGAPAICDNK